jgi:hypothetical protein
MAEESAEIDADSGRGTAVAKVERKIRAGSLPTFPL